MRNPIFNTLDVIVQIDYQYFMLNCFSESKEMTDIEIRKQSMLCLRSIIRNKKKLGYDTSIDEKTHKEIKALKL